MYYCTECKARFTAPEFYSETHGFLTPPYEERLCCPMCKSSEVKEVELHYCRACGARTAGDKEYCSSSCRKRGDEMRRREARLKRMAECSELSLIVRETENYNRCHATNYSYGEYVALILPEKRGKKR